MDVTAPRAAAARHPFALLTGIALAVGTAWGVMVPAFEAPDESYVYKVIVEYASTGARRGLPLYTRLMAPALELVGTPTATLEARRNPAFRFVSGRAGHVNMFLHGRLEGAPRGDLNRLYWLRLITLGLWTATFLLVFDTARRFFGRSDLAVLTAGLCVCLPGVSFFVSRLHPESTAAVLAALAFWAVAARMSGRIGRAAMWTISLAVVGLAPFSDHQGYFLLLFVPFALVASETSWRTRAVVAGILVVAAAAALALPAATNLRATVLMWMAPFLPGYRFGWWTPDMSKYLTFEFAPKMFLGFVGWLGQPSVLLPPAAYAAAAVAGVVAIAGLLMPSPSPPTAWQNRLGWILAGGALLAFAPILYTNILIDRTSYGRWMYPAIGPIAIGAVFGWRSFVHAIERRPHIPAAVLAGMAVALGAVWFSAFGQTIRLTLQANHYGDWEHLTRAISLTIFFLGGAAAGTEGLAFLLTWTAVRWRPSPMHLLAGAVVANLVVLFAFVAPLYREPDENDFAELVRFDASRGDFPRAAAIYQVAVSANPRSTTLRQVGIDLPMILLRGDDDQLLANLRTRIGRGDRLQSRDELVALARVVPKKTWLEPEVLRQVIQRVEPVREVREALALLRAEADGRLRDDSAAVDVIQAGEGHVADPGQADMHGEARLLGFTVYPRIGHREVTVYFRPTVSWTGRRLWMHYYPPASQNTYFVAEDVIPQFDGWKVGELAWETFLIPDYKPYVLYVGIDYQHNLGPANALGPIDR